MMKFTLYTSDLRGSKSNCVYPNKVEVTDNESFIKAIRKDHVCAEYKDNYRSNDNFIPTDVLPMDCDNDHSDDPDEWVDPRLVSLAFPDCAFLVSYSRNHMKVKEGKSARPRFHVYFPINEMTDGKAYADLKVKIQQHFPYFDGGALGEARFLFGTEDSNVDCYEGPITVDDFMLNDAFVDFDAETEQIKEGSRNSTMSRIAARIIKRYGPTDEARQMFLDESDRCTPPLELDELNRIWNSARKFGVKVAAQEGYIDPKIYNTDYTLKPDDFSDVGQALVLTREYGDRLRYSPATDYLVYNGSFWE